MARPTDKEGLLRLSHQRYMDLWELINTLSLAQQKGIFPFEDRDKTIRDVLIHLYEWHQLLLDWASANQQGEPRAFLPEPYNWKTYPQMNIEFWQKHQSTSLEQAKQLLDNSHKEVMALIQGFSNEALFTKKYFTWTGSTSLGGYAVSSTSSHYDWAIKKIKKYKKSLK